MDSVAGLEAVAVRIASSSVKTSKIHQGKRKVEIHGNNSLIVTITVNYLYYQITLIGTFWGGWSGNFTVISGNSVFIT